LSRTISDGLPPTSGWISPASPIWLQKKVGKWTFDGGAGYQVVPQDGFRNFPYTGWLVKKELSERLELGA
jgi:hypothetical protein